MKWLLIFTAAFFFSLSSLAQRPSTISLNELLAMMDAKEPKIQVFNFWATWCGPCVKELPLFEKLQQEAGDRVDVTLVSMDLDLDPNPEKVYRFVERKRLQSKVVLLNEQNPTEWIGKVDERWSGALPATIIINPSTGQRKFVGKSVHEGDLERLVSELE